MKNIAVKVVRADPAYIAWAKFCMNNPKNPWLPKIREMHKVKFSNMRGAGHVLFMEKLNEFDPYNRDHIQLRDNLSPIAGLGSYYLNTNNFWKEMSTADRNLRDISNFLSNTKFGIDLHEANYMVRTTPNGLQLVITDPIAGACTWRT